MTEEPVYRLAEVWVWKDQRFSSHTDAYEAALKAGEKFPIIGYGYVWDKLPS